MYNQSNAITCPKQKVKFVYLKWNCTYLLIESKPF